MRKICGWSLELCPKRVKSIDYDILSWNQIDLHERIDSSTTEYSDDSKCGSGPEWLPFSLNSLRFTQCYFRLHRPTKFDLFFAH